MKVAKIGMSTHYDFVESFLGREILELYKKYYNPDFSYRMSPDRIVMSISDLNSTINDAFDWSFTPEGHMFWSQQHNIISTNLNRLIE